MQAVLSTMLCMLQIDQMLTKHTQTKWHDTDTLCAFLVAKDMT
jgi:hypothetical protein